MRLKEKTRKTMPFTKQKLTFADLKFDNENIGVCLGRYCTAHFAGVIGAGAEINYASCNAAVAIEPHGAYDKLPPTFDASVIYGNSRLFRELDPDFNALFFDPTHGLFSNSSREEHAEQVAIKIANNKGRFFTDEHGECHLFVELSPCPNCANWLNERPETWNVYYLYDYEQTTQRQFATAKRGAQLEAITDGKKRGKARRQALNN